MDDLDVLVERVLSRVQAEVPFYARIPIDELRPVHAALGVVLISLSLIEQRVPTHEERALIRQRVRERADQGLPAESTLLGIQIALGEFWQAAFEKGRELAVSEAAFGRMIPQLNEIAAITMAVLLEEHRRIAEDSARLDEQRRVQFLRGALLGSSPVSELLKQAVALGVSTDRQHRAIRARHRKGEEIQLVHAGMRPDPVVLAVIDGDLAGLISAAPEVANQDLVVGVGPPADLESLSSSFRLATRALETAIAFSRAGVVGVEDLGLLAAIDGEVDVSEMLRARYLLPLQGAKRLRQELTESLRAMFDKGMDVRAAAKSLSVHPNTLRYRLRKFEELTGADLGRMETLFEIWWTLQHDHLRRHSST